MSPSVVLVSSSMADQFVFSGGEFFSELLLRKGCGYVGDGAMLKLNNGQAGVNELWRYALNIVCMCKSHDTHVILFL